ncbi:hypothetical protein [Brachybacterium aquaticum]|uniref:Uncharacterized protein n=1 Tax=Brachybacterium aquaticum TaxID=1432564 RepID=A0A841A9U7_9MICO|nr:hypothetical protein [Brachybacterium aquaticum]MBB5831606.1 hypothetical protein [Brachybacterium aquaticum]
MSTTALPVQTSTAQATSAARSAPRTERAPRPSARELRDRLARARELRALLRRRAAEKARQDNEAQALRMMLRAGVTLR